MNGNRLAVRWHRLCWCLGLLMWVPQLSWAVGTAAGTVISNLAPVKYMIGPSPPSTATSNTVSLRVDEIIQPVLTWQDTAPVPVPGRYCLPKAAPLAG